LNYTSPKQIGDYNKNQMLSILRERGPTSRVELSQILEISPTAVTRNTSILLKNNIIRECGSKVSIMGRKPVLIELCGDFCYILGADIVGGTIKVALADLMGKIIIYYEEPIYRNMGAHHVLEQMINVLKNTITESGIPKNKILAVTIGTSGIFDPGTGKSMFVHFLDGWEDIDIRKEVFEAISIETLIENDVNLDLIGESWKGVGKNYENILYVKLGQGLASRFVIQNKLIRGEHKIAGEIGYMLPGYSAEKEKNYEDLLCNDAVSQQYTDMGGKNKVISVSDLCKFSDEGDAIAEKIKENLLDRLAVVLLNSVTVLDPQVIVLGGDASSFKEREITRLKQRIEQYFPISLNIVVSMLDKKACLYGAIKMSLQEAERQIAGFW